MSARLRCFQASNSTLIASQIFETVDFDTVACGPSASASAASTSRTDRPRTNPAMTSDSRGADDACPEQAGGERPGRGSELGTAEDDGAGGRLDRDGVVAVAGASQGRLSGTGARERGI